MTVRKIVVAAAAAGALGFAAFGFGAGQASADPNWWVPIPRRALWATSSTSRRGRSVTCRSSRRPGTGTSPASGSGKPGQFHGTDVPNR